MGILRKVRAVAGLAAVLTLLGLFTAEFFTAGDLEPARIQVLLALIAALLGLDLAGNHLPFTVTAEGAGDDGEETAQNESEND